MAVLIGTALSAAPARAQVSRQALTFAIYGQYQTNEFHTNSSLTNEHKTLKPIEIATRDMVKALALDYAGTNWTSLTSAALVRETDFTNGVAGGERIFLHRGSPPTNLDVSTNFRLSFTNNFTHDVAVNFPGAARLRASSSAAGGTFPGASANTNSLVSDGLFSVSFYTTNMQFNLVGYGTTTETIFHAARDGADYSGPVQRLQMAGVGTFGLNVSTNFFEGEIVSDPDTNFASGPARGSFSTGEASFITNSVTNLFGP